MGAAGRAARPAAGLGPAARRAGGPPGAGGAVAVPAAAEGRVGADGPLPLHPMMFSDLLDGSFRLLKANLGAIVLVAAVFLIPVNLVAAFFQRDLLGGYGFLEFMDPSLAEQAAGARPSNAP